jgi:hypothetical protein
MRLSTRVKVVCVLGFFAAGTAMAAWNGTCQVDFAVAVTMDGFVGHVTTEPFAVAEDGGSTSVDVQIKNMDTGKKGRTEDMFKMFSADKFPAIRAVVSSAGLMTLKPDATNELPFQLAITGQTNEVKGTLINLKETDGRRTFDAVFPVSLKSFGLKAPSMMLGAIKVADVVKVTAHVTFDSKAPAKP